MSSYGHGSLSTLLFALLFSVISWNHIAPHWNVLMLKPSPGLGHPDSHNLQLKSAFLSQLPHLRYSATATETPTNVVMMWLTPVIPMELTFWILVPPDTSSILRGYKTFRQKGITSRTMSIGNTFGAHIKPLVSPVLSDKNCPIKLQCHYSLVQCMRSSDYGLKPLKPWAK